MAGRQLPELDVNSGWDHEKGKYIRPGDAGYDLLAVLAQNKRLTWEDNPDGGVLVPAWVLGLMAKRLKEISDQMGLGPLQP